MLAIALTALTVLQVATPAMSPLATEAGMPRIVASAAPSPDTPADEHVTRAHEAFRRGDFDVARREFVIAAALERDAGRMPVVASFGLSRVLFAQSNSRDAARVLSELAYEAAGRGDDNTEARALVDAIWLNRDSGQTALARLESERLRELLKGGNLTADTRKLIAERTF